MQIRQVSENVGDLTHDQVVVPVFGDPDKDPNFKALDKARDGRLRTLASREEFTGKAGQSLTWTDGASQLLLVGMGDKQQFQLADLRDLAARAARYGRSKGAKTVALVLPPHSAKNAEHALELAAVGAVLGVYKFDKYLAENKRKPSRINEFDLVTNRSGKATAAQKRKFGAAVKRGEVIGAAVCRARDLVNEPAGYMTPTQMAAEAREVAKRHGLTVKVLGAKECEKLNMGMFLAVGKGSDEEPKLIHLTYKPKRAAKKRVALIGKGVTFDSGGYSLKPSSSMEDMKIDMSGAAAVISAMAAIAELGCSHEVHAIAACCENLVSGRAYKLGDVLVASDGTTVEINNTDAEGRLTLGDAMTYAREQLSKAGKGARDLPMEMFDFATLTGACMIALGHHTAGVMSTDERLVKDWMQAAERSGEDMWRLPLTPRLRDQLKSNIADMRNTGERYGGAITAGLFLKHFAKDTPWVHVDLAGPASTNQEAGVTAKGGTGFGVATIVEYLTR